MHYSSSTQAISNPAHTTARVHLQQPSATSPSQHLIQPCNKPKRRPIDPPVSKLQMHIDTQCSYPSIALMFRKLQVIKWHRRISSRWRSSTLRYQFPDVLLVDVWDSSSNSVGDVARWSTMICTRYQFPDNDKDGFLKGRFLCELSH